MPTELWLLLSTAATLGFVHTILGPDHYLPFIAIAGARKWSSRRAFGVTFLCGIGHVLSSALIGAGGLLLGTQALKLSALEAARGEVATWLLIGFGLTYLVWGVRRTIRKSAPRLEKPAESPPGTSIAPWVLFVIFVFGPCEPLIPLLMYPAATASLSGLVAVTVVFGLFTVGTMLGMVYAGLKGLSWLPRLKVQAYSHALAGSVILACGAGIIFLGW